MGREITKRHSLIFERRTINPFSFAQDIYRYGKGRELASFMVWEALHKLGLFPKEKYLNLDNGGVIGLKDERLDDATFDEKMERFFSDRGLTLARSAHNWKLLFTHNNQAIFGCLYPDDQSLYRSEDNGQSVTLVHRFPQAIKSIFVSSRNSVVVCVKGAVYTGSENGASFKKTLELGSSESFFRHNNAIAETPDGTLIMGEYGNVWEKNGWRKLAYLYFSQDNGKTWETSDFLIEQGTNKHVHLVKYSKALNKLFVADGDNYKRLWVSDSLNGSARNPKWNSVTKIHIQMGGYTSVVENGETIFFGTDYQGGTNFLVMTDDGKNFVKKVVPDPYRRSPIDNMVQRRSNTSIEIWANLPYSTGNTKCLLMCSADGGANWIRFIEYNKATHKVWLLSSSTEITDELYLSIESTKNPDRVVYKISN